MNKCVFALVFFLLNQLYAAGGADSSTILQGVQNMYSGDKYESFGEIGEGFGFEIMKIQKCTYLCNYVKVRLNSVEGQQKFIDDTTEKNLKFSFYQGQGEYGYRFYPMAKTKDGFNMNLSLGVALSYNYLSFSSSTLTKLKETEQTLSGAGIGGIGGELGIKLGKGVFLLTGEVTYQIESTKLADQSPFQLSGVGLHLGLGW